jgi:ADP-heptose:LPS heptosyltransferase
MPEPRFLVVRLGSLGDIVHTFPAVAGLRKSFPGSEIVWLTHPRWKFLVESSSLASEVWPAETRSPSSVREILRQIRKAKWDAAIDYQGLWKSAALPFLGGVKRRIGFSSETIREYAVPILYTERVRCTKIHIADQNGELSAQAGANKPVAEFNLRALEDDAETISAQFEKLNVSRYIVLSPGGGWRSKCWPPDRFGRLCKMIRDSLGLRSVLNYGPGEGDLVAAVRAASGNSDPLPYNGALGPLMAVLRSAACIVGGDTGPLHLAVALGTPAVALFGPTDPARNGPYRGPDSVSADPEKDIVLRSPRARTSHKRRNQPDPSMLEISVDAAFSAVRRCVGRSA